MAFAVSLAGVAAGCGKSGLDDIDEGQSFEMSSLRMNVLYDRFLNPAQTEDAGYVSGAPAAPEGKEYFGVFLLITNDGDHEVPLPSASDFSIEDTTKAKYVPADVDNDFTFPYGQTVAEDHQVPDPDSIAAAGPTQGSLVLFLLDQGVTENRPLTLHIRYLGEQADIKLDL
ncbi:MAG: hypothetical protein ABR536_07185 [Solirubrobacterales bacterium]